MFNYLMSLLLLCIMMSEQFDDGISIEDVPNDEILLNTSGFEQQKPKPPRISQNNGNKFDELLKPYIQRLKEVDYFF